MINTYISNYSPTILTTTTARTTMIYTTSLPYHKQCSLFHMFCIVLLDHMLYISNEACENPLREKKPLRQLISAFTKLTYMPLQIFGIHKQNLCMEQRLESSSQRQNKCDIIATGYTTGNTISYHLQYYIQTDNETDKYSQGKKCMQVNLKAKVFCVQKKANAHRYL